MSAGLRRGGHTQRRVRATIAEVGGYWRPLAGVVRLLEELGELAESLTRPTPSSGELASELADLWIITTIVADQFLADVAEPNPADEARDDARVSLEEIVAAAAQIARIVNYYDGPKMPREVDRLPTLHAAVALFHRLLAAHARAYGVDLGSAVNEKLEAITVRDAGRFARDGQDPSTALCVDELRSIAFAGPRSDSVPARLWGVVARSPASVDVAACEILPTLTSFARAAPRERLDAYVIAVPEPAAVESFSAWVGRLLSELSHRDPSGRARHLAAGGLERSFTFGGLAMTVALFSPPYDTSDSRPTPTGAFAVLRPSREAPVESAEDGRSCPSS